MDLERIILQLRRYGGHIQQAASHLELALHVEVKRRRGRPRKVRTLAVTNSEPVGDGQDIDPLVKTGL